MRKVLVCLLTLALVLGCMSVQAEGVLTPGTYTVFQEKDRFVIHCLRREYAEGLEDSSFVHLLRRLK